MSITEYSIDVPVTEFDLEEFKRLVYSGKSFSWSFMVNEDADIQINVHFVQEDEEEED